MLLAPLFVTASNWKLKFPLTSEWRNKLLSICTMDYYSVINRNELLIHATTRMNLKIIMLSETSQKQ